VADFPLRIERYDGGHLTYLYEAENLRTWNGMVFPARIREASYGWDDDKGAIPFSSFCVTVDSFEPNRGVAREAFRPPFTSATSVKTYGPSLSSAAAPSSAPPGRRLPGFDGIALDFRPEQAQGQRLLICFFDLAQRPSRHGFLQLAQQGEPLEQSGVTLIGIEASRADQGALETWLKEQNIRLPVGRIEGDVEQVKSSWGVRSLPWLVLTDRDHAVTAEGFPPDELNQKLAQTGETPG
jgi:hypothetical protein